MNYEVKSIENSETKEWLLKKHYAKRLCSISFAFGLFKDLELIGVCTYGMPPSSTLGESIAGKENSKYVIELNRLIIKDNLPKNTLSFFVSQTLKLLPKNKIVVSFADKNVGHSGYIYQATNFIYTGLSSNTTKLIDEDGKEFHFRNIGHYQKNNKLNGKKVKRRVDEDKIDRVEIAKYLKFHKGKWSAKELDKIFGYKDTAAHWFRIDKGFSFPKVDDWFKLKKLLNLCDKFDNVMTKFKMIPCPQDIKEKLNLKTIVIQPKHRYVFLVGSKTFKKRIQKSLKLKNLPYPKGENKRYDASHKVTVQQRLF